MPGTARRPLVPRGRPRSQRADRAVLAAALALVRKGGYPAATIEAIAARSGVAKTTIYRRWPNRAALVVDLLMQLSADAAPPPAGRNPVRALRAEFELVAKAVDALPGRLLMALVGEAQHDPQVRAALNEGLFDPRREASAEMVRRAQAAGVLREGAPPLVALELLYGGLFYRGLMRRAPVTRKFLDEAFGQFLAGLAPRARPKRAASHGSMRAKRRGRAD